MTQLSDIYDGDKFKYRDDCARLRPTYRIPHPLTGVLYGDGVLPDTTAGKVYTPRVLFGGYKDAVEVKR